MAKKAPRTKNKDNARRSKKKTSVLVQESVEYIDYKDINLLRRFMSDRAKIRARRVTGNDAQQQREVARRQCHYVPFRLSGLAAVAADWC